ncbi:MAG: 2-oxo acid dehydrogenase subunit E2 [Bacteroidia bacterium]
MTEYRINTFPKSRIATNDICAIGVQRHHVAAMIEVDVSVARAAIQRQKEAGNYISLTAWLIQVISQTIHEFDAVAAFSLGKRKTIIFKDVNVSIVVEKEVQGHQVPIPLIIEKANERSIGSIMEQIEAAKVQRLGSGDIVLHRKPSSLERLYYHLPGVLRRYVWRYMLRHPKLAFSKMGNVAFTSVGMMGNVNGWFLPISIHPICFGVGSIIKKPAVVNDQIEIREILNMTILMDHDVVDGGTMARFVVRLSEQIGTGAGL